MVAIIRSALFAGLLATSSYAFAVQTPPSFIARNTAVKMTGGAAATSPAAPPPELKV